MSVTLKEYIEIYQSKRKLNSPSESASTLASEPDFQKIVGQKISQLKQNLKKYLEDLQVYSFFQEQINEIRDIVLKTCHMTSSKSTKSVQSAHDAKVSTKHSKQIKRSKLTVPTVSLEDEMPEQVVPITHFTSENDRSRKQSESQILDLRTISLPSEQSLFLKSRKHIEKQKQQQKMSPPSKPSKTQFSNYNKPKSIQMTPNPKNSTSDYKVKITPQPHLFKEKDLINIFLPPKLQKANSFYDDELRITITSRSELSAMQSRHLLTH